MIADSVLLTAGDFVPELEARGDIRILDMAVLDLALDALVEAPASGFVQRASTADQTVLTAKNAAWHDSGAFEDVLDSENIARSVWADTAYRSAKNEAAIRRAGLKSMIHFRKPKGKPMDRRHQRANAVRSKLRSAIEHVFATQKSHMALCVHTIGIERARMKIGMANLPYNFKRHVRHQGKNAPA